MKYLLLLFATAFLFVQCQQPSSAPDAPSAPNAPSSASAPDSPSAPNSPSAPGSPSTPETPNAPRVVEEEVEKSADEIAIEGVIQNYFDGWLKGDSTLVGSAMHASCNLKYVRDGKIGRRDRTQYLSGFKPRPRLEGGEGRILSIDITRTAAEAKIELETPERLFTDYFNLLKEGDRWYITDKVSTSIEIAEPS